MQTSGFEFQPKDEYGRWIRTGKERKKIAGWLERHSWKKDTPLQEGGITYPLWPVRHKFEKLTRLATETPEHPEWKQGPNLEDEKRKRPRRGSQRRREERNTWPFYLTICYKLRCGGPSMGCNSRRSLGCCYVVHMY